MKWLPVPSVPRWTGLLALPSFKFGDNLPETPGKRRPCLDDRRTRIPRRFLIAFTHRDVAADRHRTFDRGAYPLQIVGQVAGGQRCPRRHHAAADVDVDRRKDYRALGRNDRADGGAVTDMHVGYHGNVPEGERHPRRAGQPSSRLGVDRRAACSHLDQYAALYGRYVMVRHRRRHGYSGRGLGS